MDTPAVFDATRPLAVKLPPDGVRVVHLRFPTDDETAERQRKRKAIIKNLGRGRSETTIPQSEEADLAFLVLLRTDEGGEEIDAAEAEYVIAQVLQCEAVDVTPAPEGYRIALVVLGADTAVLLRGPTLREVRDFRKAYAKPMDLQYGAREITINLKAAGELFRKMFISAEGYAGEVPLAHQTAAVLAVIEAGERVAQGEPPGN